MFEWKIADRNAPHAAHHSSPYCLIVSITLNVSFNAGFCYVFQGGHSRPQCLRVWEYARKLWETLRRSSQNLAIWASQRMLFDATKTFCFFYICFIAKVLCCFGIRTEEIQLTALKNFQVSKALVVATEKIPLNLPNHRFETWSLHMLDN